jgi:hypothetical protein
MLAPRWFLALVAVCCVGLTITAITRLRWVAVGSNAPFVFDTWSKRGCLVNGPCSEKEETVQHAAPHSTDPYTDFPGNGAQPNDPYAWVDSERIAKQERAKVSNQPLLYVLIGGLVGSFITRFWRFRR